VPGADHDVPGAVPERRRLGTSYLWLLGATCTSSLGDGLVLVAFPLLATTLTSRPLSIAGVAIAGRLPWLLVSLPAGALVDRVDRRRLVAGVEILRAFVLLAVGLDIVAGAATLPVLYLAAFVVGALETAFAAAILACVPTLVESRDLPRANGYLFAAETAGEQFAGPALGGAMFGWAAALPFLGDALSFVGSAALLTVALPKTERRHSPRPTTLLADMRIGLKWFRAHALVRLLAVVVGIFAFCQTAVLSVLVLYGRHVLRLSNAAYGVFLAVGAIGDVGGSLLAHRAHAHLGAARAIGLAGIAAAAGYLILAATSNAAIAVTGYALEAAAVALGNVATMSLRHRVIPTELFGRVNNAFRMCVLGMMPLGALAGGVLAARFGLPTTFLIAGVTQICLIAIILRRLTTEVRLVTGP
jgi:predicted MFS family arabinose efflux permease